MYPPSFCLMSRPAHKLSFENPSYEASLIYMSCFNLISSCLNYRHAHRVFQNESNSCLSSLNFDFRNQLFITSYRAAFSIQRFNAVSNRGSATKISGVRTRIFNLRRGGAVRADQEEGNVNAKFFEEG